MREEEQHSGLVLTNLEIKQRLMPIARLRTLDRGTGNEVLEVGDSSVRVRSDEPLEDDEPTDRRITFDLIRDFKTKPHRSIRRALARIVGFNVPKA